MSKVLRVAKRLRSRDPESCKKALNFHMKDQRGSARVALAETFQLALDTLRSHKLRSFLT
jgi:hypothetical protein